MRIRIRQLFFIAAVMATLGMTGLLATGCRGSAQNEAAQGSEKKAVQYTCSMHPEVVQDKPGDCPKCGMKLVEKH